MLMIDRLEKIALQAVKLAKSDYIQLNQEWFPRSLLPKFESDFVSAASLPFSKELCNLGVTEVKAFDRGMDSLCYLSKDGQKNAMNICLRLTEIKKEPQLRSPVDFNLQPHCTYTNAEYRIEILPLISMQKSIRGLPLSRLFSTLCEGVHELGDTRLGLADMGVLPDGTVLNVDAGSCSLPDQLNRNSVKESFLLNCQNYSQLPEQFKWRTPKNELKQDIFFAAPF